MVKQSLNTLPAGTFALSFYWTADGSGNVPATLASSLPEIAQGMRILQVETVPGSPAPTNNYSIALKNSFGTDLMAGAMVAVSSSANQLWPANSASPPFVGLFSLVITGNLIANAQGTVIVYFAATTIINSNAGSPGPAGPTGPAGPAGPTGGGYALSTDYNFTPQQPGGGLTATITATINIVGPILGLNGTDTKHYLYVSGGTGTAEAVLIIGGTYVAGALTGTIIFTPANSHSGAWTISSATQGITEAETFLKSNTTASGGGLVLVPAGSWQMYAPIPWRQNIQFWGEGASTIIIPAASNAVVFDSDVPTKGSSQNTLTADNVGFFNFLIDGHTYTNVNSIYGIRGLNQSASTEIWSFWAVTVSGVIFNNVFNAVYLERSHWVRVIHCDLYCNSQFTFTDSTVNATYQTTDVKITACRYSWHYMTADGTVATMTAPIVTFINTALAYVEDCQFDLPGGVNAFGITFAGTGEDLTVVNTHFQNVYTAFFFLKETISATDYFPGFIKILGNSFDQIWGPLFTIGSGNSTANGAQVAHMWIANNYFTDMVQAQGSIVNFFNSGSYTKHVAFCGNLFRNLYGSATQTGLIIGAQADDISFDATNRILNETGDVSGSTGVFVSSSALGVYGLNAFQIFNCGTAITDGSDSVASAATVTLPVGRSQVTITGTTGITSITAAPASTTVLLVFSGILTVTDGSNLKLAGNLTTTANTTLSLLSDGTNWIEVARSVN